MVQAGFAFRFRALRVPGPLVKYKSPTADNRWAYTLSVVDLNLSQFA
jgi:hypothetical protein